MQPTAGGFQMTCTWLILQYRQDKRLADFAERDAFRRFLQSRFETLDRFPERFETQAEGLVMHWHDELRTGVVGHLHRFFRITMSPDPRVVTTDRHDRQIDATVAAQFRKAVRHGRVSAENNSVPISLENVTVVPAVIITLLARTPMLHAKRGHVDVSSERADRLFFSPAEFGHFAQSRPAEQILCV